MANKPLTIVQLVPELNCGGVEEVTVELSSELARLGHRSVVVSSGGKLVESLRKQGVEHFEIPIRAKSPLTLKSIFPLRKLLRELDADIVHAHSRIPGWIAQLTLKTLRQEDRPRFVTTAHGLYRANRYSEVMTHGDRVIAISETVEEYLREHYEHLDTNCLRTIPLGIDVGRFSPDFRPSHEWLTQWHAEFPQLENCPIVSLIGRIVRLKGHLDLIEIIDQLRGSLPNVKALIVGGTDPRRKAYAEELHQEVQRRGLEENIIFTGQRNDIREIYAISNVVLGLTSNPPEAFGRTTIEALSMGVPVVGYNHGGTGEILRKVFPEGLIDAGDHAMAAEKIEKFLTTSIKVPAGHNYLKSQMLEQTVAVYEELAA